MPSVIGLGAQAQVDVDLRLLLLEQDLRRVGLLQRQVLQVHALDLEHGVRVGVGHGEVFREMKRPAVVQAVAGPGWAAIIAERRRAGVGSGSGTVQARGQQRHQAAALVERDQVVAAADVGVADEDLRHRAAAGELPSCARAAPGSRSTRISSICATPRWLQQRLGPDAEGADLRGVHAHWCSCMRPLRADPTTAGAIVGACDASPGLRRVDEDDHAAADFSSGRLASRQAARPPASAMRAARSRALRSSPAARAARAPVRAHQHQRQRLVPRQVLGALAARRAARCARRRRGRRRTRPAR